MSGNQEKGERIAKLMARVGLCSRREAEQWIADGRVEVNGKRLISPALNVSADDQILVDGKALPSKERTRLWLYHKPAGLVTSSRDNEGRPTVFGELPKEMPRVISVGRLDINTEGLLLLTNDGALARYLELPSTGWLRRYRVRAFGRTNQAELDRLADGIAIDGILYGSVEARLEREQGANNWITIGLREGKNREVKRILEHLGLTVNRLIRISYGPFQLGEVESGAVSEIRGRILRDQLGESVVRELGLYFPRTGDAEVEDHAAKKERAGKKGSRPNKSKPDRNMNRSGDSHGKPGGKKKRDVLDRLDTRSSIARRKAAERKKGGTRADRRR